MIDIYVHSCGLAPDHDYRWLKINEDGQSIDTPPLLQEEINTKLNKKVYLTDLYKSDDRSIVLAKYDSNLLLLVTALKAIERSKLYRRKVRNSVAFIGEYPKHESVLRIIAANALENLENWEKFRDIIDKAVEFDKNQGFIVKIDSINKYIDDVKKEVDKRELQKPNPYLTRKVAKDSPDIRKKLAEELQDYRLPENWNGPLVIVTGNVSEEVLTQYSVWRSISERVKQEEGENWKEIPDTDKQFIQELFLLYTRLPYLPHNVLLVGILVLVIASIALLIVLKFPPPKSQPNQPPQTIPKLKIEPRPSRQVTPQLKLQASPLPQATPEQESKQSQLHQETLQLQTTTQENSSSNSSSTDTTEPNATNIPPKNLTAITASEQELQPITDMKQEVDSKLQQPIDQTLQSELVEPPNNSSNSNGESNKAHI